MPVRINKREEKNGKENNEENERRLMCEDVHVFIVLQFDQADRVTNDKEE